MIDSYKMWCQDFERSRPVGSPSITWDQFSQLFMVKFIPFTLREEYRRQFERLQQGGMTLTQYETRFVDLARHAAMLIPTNRERERERESEEVY